MDRQGFIDFNTRLSPENSGKADSYARAISILDEVLPYQDAIDLHGQSLYNIADTAVIESVLHLVNSEVRKMKAGQQSIFDHGNPNQRIIHKNNPHFNRHKFQFEFQNGEVLRLKLYEHLKM